MVAAAGAPLTHRGHYRAGRGQFNRKIGRLPSGGDTSADPAATGPSARVVRRRLQETAADGVRLLGPGRRAVRVLAGAQEPHHRAQEDADDGLAELVVPGEQVPDVVRQTQDPLPDGHGRKDVVHQMDGVPGHPPGTVPRPCSGRP